MKSKITIEDREVEMLANAASPILYRRVFQKDFLKLSTEVSAESGIEALGIYEEMGFIMAMQASKPQSALVSLNVSDYISWLSTFDNPYSVTKAAPDIATLYNSQELSTSTAKKVDG